MDIDGEFVDLSGDVVSVDKWNGNAYAIFYNGVPIRRFFGTDARERAMGHAMAFIEQRTRSCDTWR